MDRNGVDTVSHQHLSVALRKESVDRNEYIQAGTGILNFVALRKESVDRNGTNVELHDWPPGRSPQGERG